jgi:hypothetical protein
MAFKTLLDQRTNFVKKIFRLPDSERNNLCSQVQGINLQEAPGKHITRPGDNLDHLAGLDSPDNAGKRTNNAWRT